MVPPIAGLKRTLEDELGLSPTDDELEAMIELTKQPKPEFIIWAYTGAKKHSQYFSIEDISCSREEFDALLDRVGLDMLEEYDLQQKGWGTRDDFYMWALEFREQSDFEVSTGYDCGLWLDIPDCCALGYAKLAGEANKLFFEKYPITEDYTFDELNEHLQKHRYWEDYHGEWNDHVAPTHTRIETGELPNYLHFLLWSFIPCSPDCEEYREQSHRMYRSVQLFLGDECADTILEDYSY